MQVDFAPSEQSTVGIEWELAIVDLASGELTPAAPTVLQACGGGEDAPIRKEYLQDMVEIVSGVHRTVAAAVDLLQLRPPKRRDPEAPRLRLAE